MQVKNGLHSTYCFEQELKELLVQEKEFNDLEGEDHDHYKDSEDKYSKFAKFEYYD